MKETNTTRFANKLFHAAWMVCLAFLVSSSSLQAGIFVNLSSPDVEYTAGQDNTFTFNVNLTTTGVEWVDRFQFEFPAGITVQSGTPPSGSGACGSNAGIQQICSPSISWTRSGVPCSGAYGATGCGAYISGNFSFTATVSVPANFSGPLVVTLYSTGDGFLLPEPSTDQDAVTFAQAMPPATCEPICPNDIVINLDPGACDAIVNYTIGSTGDCQIVTFDGFVEQGDWTFANTPSSCGGTFNGGGLPGTVVITTGNVGIPGYSLYTKTFPEGGSITFDWTYSTSDGPFWDHIGYTLNGTFTPIHNQFGGLNQSGSASIDINAGDVFGVGGYTVDGFFGGATCTFTNFNYTPQPVQFDMTITGPPSGSTLGPGEYPVEGCFVDEGTGEDVCCSFNIVINAYSGPVLTALACNDLVQVSLDANCEAIIDADVVLEGGPYHCYDDYLVYVDQYGYGNDVNGLSLNYSTGLHTTTVVDPETGNSCWGQLMVEDKIAPTLECLDFTLSCGQDLTPVFTPPIMGVNTCDAYPGLPIGPNAGVITTSTCNVSLPQGVEIVDVNVCVKITHTWIGDCNTDLISPTGAVTNLWGFGQCGPTDNMWQKFDDSGPQVVLCADINNGCDFILQPVATQLGTPSLDQYIGDNPNGTWTLMVTDNANGDGGTLDEWHLEIQYAQNAPFAPTVADNCDQNVDLAYTDSESGDLCDTTVLTRTWTATDDSGNTSQCVQTLTIEPLSLAALQCPENYVGSCGGSTDPSVTGYPTIDGVDIVEGGYCNIFVGWWDEELADCGNGTKLVRSWTILDWCTQEVQECQQVIKLTDDQAPVLVCPDDQTVGTDPWFCNRDVNLIIPEAYDACGTAFTLTPTISQGTLVHFGGDNYRADDLPLGVTTVTWTAVDVCGNESSCSYTITVQDDVPPVPVCDEHTVVTLTTDDGLQEGLTKIYATTFDDGSYDNCGPVTFLARRMDSCIDFDWIGPNGEYPNNDGGLPESIDKGLTFQPWVPFACCDVGNTVMVELRVTDLAGNVNSCMVEVEVQDKLPPYIACPPDITVSCDYWFDAHETNGFQDEDGLEGLFGRVLDAYDYNESDRADIIIDDPGNNTVSQPHNWGKDGWADDNCDVDITVRTRIFDDCSGDDLPSGGPDHAVRVIERTFRAQDGQGNTSTCRQRIWVEDFDPFYITDTQCGLNNADDVRWPCDLVLTDCPEGPLTPENLSGYAPNNAPVVNDDNCSIVGVSYDDQVFYFVDNVCRKIIRTWTVIDWCQYDPVEHTGIWTYVQVIKVHDEIGPQFEDCPDAPITLCTADSNVTLPDNNQVFLGEADPNSSSCSVHVKLTHTVYETCSDKVIYDVKVYPNNGSEYVLIVAPTEVPVDTNGEAILTMDTRQNSLPSNNPIRKYGLPYNDKVCSNWPLPGGTKQYHRVLWSVEDGCGNQNTCSYLFRLEDCKQPTPICVGLSTVVMPQGGCVTIWAADFDSGSSNDDCTAHDDLLFSFSGDTYEPSRTYCCDDIEANGSPSFLVEIWAADEGNDQNCNGFVQPLGIEWNERNKDYCTSFIVIDDNEGVCQGGPGIGGTVETEDLETVEKVTIDLIDPSTQEVVQSFTTEGNGFYQFINMNPLLNYKINAQRDDNHRNGVSTLDLVKIQKHLLGLEQLDSPYKLIAADANNSESVSALDLVEIRKLILGIYDEFPNNKSWRFVDASFTFDDPTHPWPFAEVMQSHGMVMNHNFVGVKIGDVNGNVVANATQVQTRNAKGVLELVTNAQEVTAGQTVEVPVSGANFNNVLGYQFTLHTAGLKLEGVDAGALDMSDENVGVFQNAITVSWSKAAPVSASDVLFTLRFTATESGSLGQMLSIDQHTKLTPAEAYNASEEILDLNFSVRNTPVAAGKDFALFQNEPNPFSGNTVIGFTLPKAMDATLTIFDVTGKVLRTIDGSYVQGYNEVKVNRKDISSSGVLYYRLDANDFTATKKMVIID